MNVNWVLMVLFFVSPHGPGARYTKIEYVVQWLHTSIIQLLQVCKTLNYNTFVLTTRQRKTNVSQRRLRCCVIWFFGQGYLVVLPALMKTASHLNHHTQHKHGLEFTYTESNMQDEINHEYKKLERKKAVAHIPLRLWTDQQMYITERSPGYVNIFRFVRVPSLLMLNNWLMKWNWFENWKWC